IKYKLKAEPQTNITAKTIAVSLYGYQDIDAENQKVVNYGTARSVLLPSVSGNLPKISMSNITPDTVYTEGTKTVTVSGDMSALQVLKATDMWDLYLVHTTSDSKVRIEKDNIAFTDDTYSTFIFSTDEELVVGEYELVLEFTDAQLVQQFGVTSITAGKKLNVSNDPKYKLRSYGLMALVRHDTNKYSFIAFNDESEYNSFFAGEKDFYDINGAKIAKHNYSATSSTATNEVLLIIRGNIKEASKEVNGTTQSYYQADPKDADVTINDILTYKGDEPLIIQEDGGMYKVSGDGQLCVIDSITVWRDKWSFKAQKDQVTTLDPDSYGADNCTNLELSLDGIGSVVQSIAGFLIDISYGVMSSSRVVENDKLLVYGIGFGGRISIPIKSSEDSSKKDTAKESVLSSNDPDDYSADLQNLFNEDTPAESGKQFTKDTTLTEGGLTADVKEVRFGQKTGKNDAGVLVINDVGFVGINTTLSLCLPKDVLGSLVTNAPGVYASMTINTLDDIYAVAAGLDIKAIQCEGLLSFKKTDIRGVDIILPDNIEFYIREGLQIPIVPPVLSITGLGGGINNLADTMGGEFTKLPPLTLLLFTRLKAVEMLIGDFDASVNLSGIKLEGELKLNTKDIIKSPVVINAGISAQWIDPLCFKVYGQINVIDGLIKGGITITITDKSFCGYAFVSICIPDSVPIIGGKEVAKVEAAVSNDYIGAAIKIIGIKFGVIYYWDGDLSFGTGVSLTSLDDEF
ncbi:MAG: hypothetical protein ACI4A5_08050, partial [Hominilimicola sp.]